MTAMWERIVVCSEYGKRRTFQSKLRGKRSEVVLSKGWVPVMEKTERLFSKCNLNDALEQIREMEGEV